MSAATDPPDARSREERNAEYRELVDQYEAMMEEYAGLKEHRRQTKDAIRSVRRRVRELIDLIGEKKEGDPPAPTRDA